MRSLHKLRRTVQSRSVMVRLFTLLLRKVCFLMAALKARMSLPTFLASSPSSHWWHHSRALSTLRQDFRISSIGHLSQSKLIGQLLQPVLFLPVGNHADHGFTDNQFHLTFAGQVNEQLGLEQLTDGLAAVALHAWRPVSPLGVPHGHRLAGLNLLLVQGRDGFQELYAMVASV